MPSILLPQISAPPGFSSFLEAVGQEPEESLFAPNPLSSSNIAASLSSRYFTSTPSSLAPACSASLPNFADPISWRYRKPHPANWARAMRVRSNGGSVFSTRERR
jgi:hypothetical protein